jgi:hypothetical protein
MTEEKKDYLNRDEIINKITEIIKSINCEEDNRSFAIEGKWGIGKTFIADKIEEKFENEKDFIIFKYNAWSNNYYEEPLVAIITTMIDQLNDYYETTAKGLAKEIFRDTAKSLFEILKTICKSTAILLGGDKLVQVGEEVKKCSKKVKKHAESRMIENNVDNYNTLKQTLEKLRECLTKLKKKIVFIVDEIDRCLPDYAIKVLERTHHLFEGLKGSMTIYSMDKSQLSNLIKTYYGQGFSIDTYLQKFIEFSVKIDLGVLNEQCNLIFDNFLSRFEDVEETEKTDLIKFFKLLTKEINIRQKIRIINRLDKIHEIFVKDKCAFSVCYFEIFYIIFFDYYKEKTSTFKINYFNTKDGFGLEGYPKQIYPEIFAGVQLNEVYIGVRKCDEIAIISMKDYKSLLFVYLRYMQHEEDKMIKYNHIQENKKINAEIEKQFVYIDNFIKGINLIN